MLHLYGGDGDDGDGGVCPQIDQKVREKLAPSKGCFGDYYRPRVRDAVPMQI